MTDMVDATPKKVAQVIALRYRIGISKARPLEQAGVTFDWTREGSRQIESNAICKLASGHATRALAHVIAHPIAARKSVAADLPSGHDDGDEHVTQRRAYKGKEHSPESQKIERVFVQEIPVSGDSLDPSTRPSPTRRLLNAARGLGFLIDVQAQDGRARILVAHTPVRDRTSRKIVRELLLMGFSRGHREGPRK